MKKKDLKKRFLAFMTTLVMIGSELGSSGMTLYAAEPEEGAIVSEDEVLADEETEAVSGDSVSGDDGTETGIPDDTDPDGSGEETTDRDDEFTEIGSYRFDLSGDEDGMIDILGNTKA